MKLKNVKVGETYIIKSLDHTNVGALPFDIGDMVFVRDTRPKNTNTVLIDGGWGIHHKDLKRVDGDCSPIEYTNPLQEHLGKEVITTLGRGFVVSTGIKLDDLYLLVDFGDGCDGHSGDKYAVHPYITKTCKWVHCNECNFLTEDNE
jgi:hypothetical protein